MNPDIDRTEQSSDSLITGCGIGCLVQLGFLLAGIVAANFAKNPRAADLTWMSWGFNSMDCSDPYYPEAEGEQKNIDCTGNDSHGLFGNPARFRLRNHGFETLKGQGLGACGQRLLLHSAMLGHLVPLGLPRPHMYINRIAEHRQSAGYHQNQVQ